MIELVIAERCTGCNACVEICPTNVLAPSLNGPPEIAHQQDCQTCFMCELYCREDAIYVAPDCENPTDVDKDEIVASGLLGEFRRNHGWDEWAADSRFGNEHWRMESVFLRARDMAIAEAAAKRKSEQR
ncbi:MULTISPECIES: 4Fe-4S dicluster domain-containing protein [unclassified Mesorhizobium]|uniref:4Fe-4S dicluster domain-containing protein n=1 Tax=unclassified Mesorhizobium TaxID=325217 RepID=UPI0030149416